MRNAFAVQAQWSSSQGVSSTFYCWRQGDSSFAFCYGFSTGFATLRQDGEVDRTCAAKTKPGDAVCILIGCTVPVVLRKVHSASWALIGECYIEGFMEGEFMKEVIHESFEPTLVVLE